MESAEIGIWQNMTKQRWGADIAKTCKNHDYFWGGQRVCNTIIKPTKRSKHSKWVMLIVVKLKKLRTQERRLECDQHICLCQKVVDAASRMFPLLTRLIMFVKLYFIFKGCRHYLTIFDSAFQRGSITDICTRTFWILLKRWWVDGELMVSWKTVHQETCSCRLAAAIKTIYFPGA